MGDGEQADVDGAGGGEEGGPLPGSNDEKSPPIDTNSSSTLIRTDLKPSSPRLYRMKERTKEHLDFLEANGVQTSGTTLNNCRRQGRKACF